MENTVDTAAHGAGGGAGEGAKTGILSLDTKSLQPYATQDEYLYAMKEDLAEWFNTLYALDIRVDVFFEELETGVVMCQHANNVQSFIKDQMAKDKGKGTAPKRPPVCLPEKGVQFRSNVKAGSFQCRDNVSNFISWCKALGINNVILFETEDLVLRKNEKHVVLCLLEVARRGAQYGMLAPTLVQMEREIDAEIAGQEPEPVPHVQRKTCDLMSLDEMVREMVSRCTCPDQFPMVKVSDGKYKIGESKTLIFVRILRNHVMVRIGGGWDTLQNYLDRHDPCQCHSKGHHKGRMAGIITTPSSTPSTSSKVSSNRRQSAPATQLVGLEQRMRTNTPSADNQQKMNSTAQSPRSTQSSSAAGTSGPAARSKRSLSLAPVTSSEPQWGKTSPRKSSAAGATGSVVTRSLDPSNLPGMRSPSPASSEASVASTSASTKRSGAASMSRDSGFGSSSRREADSASDASSSCGSPGLHKRFSSANDLSFPKELTLSGIDEDGLPRLRPTSARERVRRATATSSIPTTNKSHSKNNNNKDSSSRGRQKQRSETDTTPSRQARSRSVEPMELTKDRYARKANNVKRAETPQQRQKKKGDHEVLIISRDSTGKHRLGAKGVNQQNTNGDSSDQDGYPSGDSRHSSTSSSMSGPTNGYSNGSSSSSEEKRPGTPRVNISPDRILPDKPKLMSRSHTADLGHLGENSSLVVASADESTDTDTESRTQTTTRMSVSSNQSSTLSLASSFDDYPEAPPEDRNLNAEMERQFEEYRRKELKTKKDTPHKRHRRSNSADLLEKDDSMYDRQRINNAFQKARSSSRDMLDSTSSSARVRSRRSSNASVDSNPSAPGPRKAVSSSSTPRRTGFITPTPTRSSSLRGALGMAKELRNKLNEQQSTSGMRTSPGQSGSTNRPTTPLKTPIGSRGSASGGQSVATRGRSQSREPLGADIYRSGSRAGSRASSRPSSRASSRNVSRDSSLTRMRPSSAMSHREQQEKMTPRRPASARPTTSASGYSRPRSNSTTNLYPESRDTPYTILSQEGQLTCQTRLMDQEQDLHTPKPRKDKREGRTRIPQPVDMFGNPKYDPGDQPLRRYDSGVDINNMSPTESSVHGDDNWQQDLILQPDEAALQFATSYQVQNGGRSNGQATYDDMY